MKLGFYLSRWSILIVLSILIGFGCLTFLSGVLDVIRNEDNLNDATLFYIYWKYHMEKEIQAICRKQCKTDYSENYVSGLIFKKLSCYHA